MAIGSAVDGNINIVFNARANTAQAQKQIDAVGRRMALVQKNVLDLNKKVMATGGNHNTAFRQIQTDTQALRNQYRSLAESSGQYMTVQKSITANTTKFNQALARGQVGWKQVRGQMAMVREAMKEQMALNNMMVTQYSKDATGRISADIYVPRPESLKTLGNMRTQLGYYNQVVKSVSEQTVNWGKNMQWTGRQLTVGFTVPLTIAAGALSKFSLEADRGLTRIAKVYGDTENSFGATNQAIRDMAQETAAYIADQYGLAADSTRDVMAELAATGMEGRELQGMTVQTQRLSLLGEMSAEDSLRLVRVLKEVYGYSSAEMAKQVNYFNAIENSTALTMQDVTEGLPRIAGIMQATGVSIQEQTELLVAFKSAGIDIAEGANALKSINFKAIAPTSTAANNFFRITGVEMQDLIDKTEGQFLPMMIEIGKAMEGLEQQEKVDLIGRVFGIHQGSRTITLIEQLVQGSEGMMRAVEVGMQSAEAHARAADAEIATLQESLGVRWDRLIQGIRVNLEEMGAPILDMFLDWGEYVGKFINWLNELPDSFKKFAGFTGTVLAVIGPLVMLTGLVGNLVGMFGRAATSLIAVVAPFKVFEASAKAADLLQEKFGTTTARTEVHTRKLIDGVNGLTAAFERMALAAEKAARDAAGVGDVAGPAIVRGNSMAEMQAVGGTPAQIRARGMIRDSKGRFVKKGEPFGPQPKPYEAQIYGVRPLPRGGVPDPAEMAKVYKAAGQQYAEQQAATAKQNALLAQQEARWLNINRGITAASAAMTGLGMITQKEWVANLGMGTMILSSMMPLIGQSTDLMKKWRAGMLLAGEGAAGGLVKMFHTAANGISTALATVVKFLTRPWGLALSAAVGAGLVIWKRYNDGIKESIEMHKQLGASGRDALAEVYNFTPVSIMDRANDPDSTMDEGSHYVQAERLRIMKENQEDYYNAIIRKADEARQATSSWHDQQRAMVEEAMRQGAHVLQQTADPEKAKLAAWDIYNAMSEEWISFEGFKLLVGYDGEQVDLTLNSLENYIAGRLGSDKDFITDMKLDLKAMSFGGFELRREDKAAFVEEFQQMLNLISELEPDQRQSAYLEMLGEEANIISQLWTEALESGAIKADTTVQQFLSNWRSIQKDSARAGGELWGSIDDKELGRILEIMNAMQATSPQMLNDITTYGDMWTMIYAGLNDDLEEFMDKQKRQIALNKLAKAEQEGDEAAIREARRELDDITLAAAQAYSMQDAVLRGLGEINYMRFTGDGPAAGIEQIGDAAEDASEDVKELEKGLSRTQQMHLDAHRASMEQAQQDLLKPFVREYERMQDAEREAESVRAQGLIDNINSAYDDEAAILEADHKGRMKALENTHKEQTKALALLRREADKALRASQKADNKALDARNKALSEQQKNENEALKERFKLLGKEQLERQEARRKAIEESYDMQIEKINKQIETEERLEQERQKMYERERERLSRMAGLFDSNISLNMAVNSGDLDEAARIANDMQTRQSEWATQDLSEISSDASKSRRDQMEAQIEKIEERKQADLERIKEVEEAEKEALAEREKREQKALEDKFDRMKQEIEAEKEKLAEIHELQREALSDDFALRSERLSERQAKEKETLNQTTADEKAALEERRQADVAAQEDRNKRNREALDQRLSDEKASFDRSVQHHGNMIATSEEQFVQGYSNMRTHFKDVHGVEMGELDAENLSEIWDARTETYRNRLREIARDQMWEDHAERIAQAVMNGIIGTKLTPAQIKDFILNGKLPKDSVARTGNQGGSDRTSHSIRHSGGIIGKKIDDKSTGPGFYRKSQEVNLTALEGEGVLNLNAMRQPGVPELMYALNSGRKINEVNRARPANKRQTGDGPGIYGGIMAGLTSMVGRVAEVATVTGAEHGYGKMLERIGFGTTDIDYDGSAGAMSTEQLTNAGYIISTGRRLGASERDIMTALMTAMQESSLINVNYGDDIHGVRNPDGTLTSSLGLFQQQKWWGSVEDRMNPSKSAELFYRALFGIDNRENMPMWAAAQAVQRSAFPRAYARWEGLARALLDGARGSYTIASAADVEPGMTWPALWNLVRSVAPEARKTSDFRKGATTAGYGNLSYHAKGQAIDIVSPDMMKTFHKVRDLLPWNELIYTPAGRGQMVNGKPFWNFLPITKAQHYDHIHLAYDGSVASFNPIAHARHRSLEERAEDLRRAIQDIRESGIGFSRGGLVPGRGNTDSVNSRLMPGEFVMRKSITQRNVDLFRAINSGELDLSAASDSMSRNVRSAASRNIDNEGGNRYDVNIEFSGPVNNEIDFERVVVRTIREVERKKPQNRRVSK